MAFSDRENITYALTLRRRRVAGRLVVSTMTVVDDNYTGHVEPWTAARRKLPSASIVKV